MAHMLTLTSKRVDESANTMLYKAECSCGEWNAHDVAASVARELYDAHMQRVAGPEAQIAREEAAAVTRDAIRDPSSATGWKCATCGAPALQSGICSKLRCELAAV